MVQDSGLSRRGVVLAAGVAATATAALAQKPALKAQTTAPAPKSRFALMSQAPAAVQQQLANSKWSAAKKDLAKAFSFLGPFTGDLTVDAMIYEVVHGLEGTRPAYDPFQVEALATSASQLLDRCLSNRREMYDIEEQAIRRALEYNLFKDQLQPQMNIELAPQLEAQRMQEKAGQIQATRDFHSSTSDLGAAFADTSDASAKSLALAVSGEVARKASVQKKWDASKSFQEALEARHNTPGCSLNYEERFGRLELILKQDVAVAYLQLKAVEAGLKKVFGIEVQLPAPNVQGYLDAMVMFLRDAIQKAAIATVTEIEFEHVVSLRQQRAAKQDGTSPSPLITDAAWTGSMSAAGTGILEFKLDKEFSSAIQRLRILGVGASVLFTGVDEDIEMYSGQKSSAQHPRSVPLIFFPPQTADLLGGGGPQSRPPVYLGAATWYEPSQLRTVASTAVGNLDPREGSWRVQIGPNVFSGGGAHGSGDRIVDILLHLRLGAVVDASVASWPAPV